MRLIILSPSDDVADEPRIVADILRRLPVTVHLRKPGRASSRIADYLRRIPSVLHPRIMVHGHASLLARFDLMGLHFTEDARRRCLPQLPQIRQAWPRRRFSSSFHAIADIPDAADPFDYVFLSPIFDSLSKPGYRAAFHPDDLNAFLAATPHTVVALGGVDVNQIATAAALGFKGVAVLGAVWGAAEPLKAAAALWRECRQWAKAVP